MTFIIQVHDGSAESGHYTARVKNLDRRDGDHWQLFDDRNRHQIDDDAVKVGFWQHLILRKLPHFLAEEQRLHAVLLPQRSVQGSEQRRIERTVQKAVM